MSSEKVKSSLASATSLALCPVCMNVPRFGPVFQCLNGHIICRNCHPKMRKSCPTCRCKLGNARNRFVENFIEKFALHVCTNEPNGCQERLTLAEIRRHENAGCPHRQVPCPSYNCQQASVEVPMKDLLQHFQDTDNTGHSCCTVVKSDTYIGYLPIKIPSKEFQEICLQFDGKAFFFSKAWIGGFLCMWMAILGSEEDAAKYSAKINLNADEGGSYVHCSGPVFSIETSNDDISNRVTMVISKQTWKSLIYKTRRVPFNILIKKRPEK